MSEINVLQLTFWWMSANSPLTALWLPRDCPERDHVRLSGDFQVTVRWLPSDCLMTVRRLSGDCPVTVRDCQLTVSWPTGDWLLINKHCYCDFCEQCGRHVIRKGICYVSNWRILEYSQNLSPFFFKTSKTETATQSRDSWFQISNFEIRQIAFLMTCRPH